MESCNADGFQIETNNKTTFEEHVVHRPAGVPRSPRWPERGDAGAGEVVKSSRNPDAKNAANQVDKFQMRESSTRTRQECTWYQSRVRQRRWIVGMPPSWIYLDYYGAIAAYRNPLPRSYREHLVSGDEELRDRSPDYPPIQLVEGRLRVSGKRQSTRWTTYGHA
jgi:hypothetical protein